MLLLLLLFGITVFLSERPLARSHRNTVSARGFERFPEVSHTALPASESLLLLSLLLLAGGDDDDNDTDIDAFAVELSVALLLAPPMPLRLAEAASCCWCCCCLVTAGETADCDRAWACWDLSRFVQYPSWWARSVSNCENTIPQGLQLNLLTSECWRIIGAACAESLVSRW